MLVLSRHRDESIIIGDDIVITVVDIRGDKVRLGIAAPIEISVHRQEVYEAIQRENRQASRLEPHDARQIEIILYQKDLRPGLLPVQDRRELLEKVRLLRGHLQPTIRSQSERGGLADGMRA